MIKLTHILQIETWLKESKWLNPIQFGFKAHFSHFNYQSPAVEAAAAQVA